MQLFSLESDGALGHAVAAACGVELSVHEERAFEDGEHKMRPLVGVRGDDVYVVASLYHGPAQSVNDRLCRLLFFLGTLRDAGADRVTAVVPYLCYSRKDRRTKPRDPVTTRYVAALFEAVGIDCVITVDVHNPAAFENAFRCLAINLEARPVLARHLIDMSAGEVPVVVSPDVGGVKRADRMRDALAALLDREIDAGFVEKRRSAGVVSGDRLVGDVAGRTVMIVDDLISTGTTLVRASRACLDAGARRVVAAATHGLFLGQAGTLLLDASIDAIVTTDTVPPFRLEGTAVAGRHTLLPIAPLLGEAIRRLHNDGSIVDLIEVT